MTDVFSALNLFEVDLCVVLYLGFVHSDTVYMVRFGLFPLVCDYCSTGDLYTYWVMIGQFGEDVVKVFAAELGSALGKQIYMTRNTCKICLMLLKQVFCVHLGFTYLIRNAMKTVML